MRQYRRIPSATISAQDVGKQTVTVFFWLFGMFLDETNKPSMSRIMIAIWTFVGWLMINHEIHVTRNINGSGMVSISNAAWTAWWAAEGVLSLAVFGPRVAAYFAPGAAGSAASTAIGDAVREITQLVINATGGATPTPSPTPAPAPAPDPSGETPIADVNAHTGSQG